MFFYHICKLTFFIFYTVLKMEVKMDGVCASLPPGVRGHLRGYVILDVIDYTLDESIGIPVAFKIRWWGEISKGIILQPNTATIKSKKGAESHSGTACYALIDKCSDKVIGNCLIDNVASLVEHKKISGDYPIVSENSAVAGSMLVSLHFDQSKEFSSKQSSIYKGSKSNGKSLDNVSKSPNKNEVDNDVIPSDVCHNDFISFALEKGKKLREEMNDALFEEEIFPSFDNPSSFTTNSFFSKFNNHKNTWNDFEDSSDMLKYIMPEETLNLPELNCPVPLRSSNSSLHSIDSDQSITSSLINDIFYKDVPNENSCKGIRNSLTERDTINTQPNEAAPNDNSLKEELKNKHVDMNNAAKLYSQGSQEIIQNIHLPHMVDINDEVASQSFKQKKRAYFTRFCNLKDKRSMISPFIKRFENTRNFSMHSRSLPRSTWLRKTFCSLNLQKMNLEMILMVSEGRSFNQEEGSVFALTTLGPLTNFLILYEGVRRTPMYEVVPVQLNEKLLSRLQSNFIVLEIWSYKGHIALKKTPIIAVEGWVKVIHHTSGKLVGKLNVLSAIGTKKQIQDLNEERLGYPKSSVCQPSIPDILIQSSMVRHKFKIGIGELFGLNVQDGHIWGEGDCFISYKFIQQSTCQESNIFGRLHEFTSRLILCTPALDMKYENDHELYLPNDYSIHSYLLTGLSLSSGIKFYLSHRSYYPGLHDVTVAEATLSLTQLCSLLVSSSSRNESVVHNFNLNLRRLSSQSVLSITSSATLDVSIQYSRINVCDSKHNMNSEKSVQTSPGKLQCKISSPKKSSVTFDPSVKMIENKRKDDIANIPEEDVKVPVEITVECASNLQPLVANSDCLNYLITAPKTILNDSCSDQASHPGYMSQNLILKLWTKSNHTKSPDEVQGFVCINLTSLVCGLSYLSGWYNVMDFTGQCKGQMKISVTPLQSIKDIIRNTNLPEDPFSRVIHFEDSAHNFLSELDVDNLKKDNKKSVSKENVVLQGTSISEKITPEKSLVNVDEELPWNISIPIPLPEDTTQSILLQNLQKNLNELQEMQERLTTRFVMDSSSDSKLVTKKSSIDCSEINAMQEKIRTKKDKEQTLQNVDKISNSERCVQTENHIFDQNSSQDKSRVLLSPNDVQKPEKPNLISSNQCSNVKNIVNITLNNQYSDSKSDNSKQYEENELKNDEIWDFIKSDKNRLASECGTYNVLDEHSMLVNVDNKQSFEDIEAASSLLVEKSVVSNISSTLPEKIPTTCTYDIADSNINGHSNSLIPLEKLENSVKQLSMVLSNLCNNQYDQAS
ncbi:C2 domain-containing protein 3 [Nymphon striatum]|nr:C2 domain-containing protein 3 [Nymphon striatum]